MTEIGELLKRSLLTYGLSDDQTESIAALGRKENFVAGEYVATLGSRDSDLFVLLDGKVSLLTADNDKKWGLGGSWERWLSWMPGPATRTSSPTRLFRPSVFRRQR
jgi:hypothetical protein